MIVAENLVYHIQGRRLTDDVSLTLPDGEIIAILGPNGAGKSTLLRQLTGYLQPHSGRCSMFGKPLDKWSITELAKTRAVMRQNSHMAFPFSVQEVIRMGRHPYRTRNTGDETEHIMTLCDCQALAARDYRHLSGGEQQRVQLARLLVQLWEPEPRPKWLFLDEPTSALDAERRADFLHLLLRESAEAGFIYSHNMQKAPSLGNDALLMSMASSLASIAETNSAMAASETTGSLLALSESTRTGR